MIGGVPPKSSSKGCARMFAGRGEKEKGRSGTEGVRRDKGSVSGKSLVFRPGKGVPVSVSGGRVEQRQKIALRWLGRQISRGRRSVLARGAGIDGAKENVPCAGKAVDERAAGGAGCRGQPAGLTHKIPRTGDADYLRIAQALLHRHYPLFYPVWPGEYLVPPVVIPARSIVIEAVGPPIQFLLWRSGAILNCEGLTLRVALYYGLCIGRYVEYRMNTILFPGFIFELPQTCRTA